MAAKKWTDEQRAQALRLYDEVGACEAGKRTGIPQATISSWARRTGVQSSAPAATKAAVDHLVLKWAERKLLLTDKLGYLAERLIDRALDADARDVAHFATGLDKAIANAQLLAGGATGRIEHDVSEPQSRLAAVHQLKDAAQQRAAAG